MGIERARVVEVHSPGSVTRRVGSGYLVGERLVLTAGGLVDHTGPTAVRPAGTAVWYSSSRVWLAPAGDAAIVEVDDDLAPPGAMRWGDVSGHRPVPVAAMGFPPATVRPDRYRDAGQFFGHLRPDLAVEASGASRLAGEGLDGAALFAGAELVGVLLAGAAALRAVPVAALAGDPSFVDLVGAGGRLDLSPVSAPASGFPIL
jgi:hypothetical protein